MGDCHNVRDGPAGPSPGRPGGGRVFVIQIDVSDTIFLFCLLVGGGLLLVSVVLGELLGGIGDAVGIDHDMGGSGVVPPILAFVSLFGAGGLFAARSSSVERHRGGHHRDHGRRDRRRLGRPAVPRLQADGGRPEFKLEDVIGSTGRVKVSVGPTGSGRSRSWRWARRAASRRRPRRSAARARSSA